MRTPGFIALLAAAGILAGCNSNNGLFGPSVPTPGPNCGGPPSARNVEVLWPKPNSAAANPNASSIYVASNGAFAPNNTFDLALQYVGGPNAGLLSTTSGFSPVTAGQLPRNHAKPTYANPVYYVATSQTAFGTVSTIQVLWNYINSNCTPNVSLSTFSTS